LEIKNAKLGNSDNMADKSGEIVCSGGFSGQTAGNLEKKGLYSVCNRFFRNLNRYKL